MMEATKYRNMVPLVKAVKAAIVDTYQDIGRTQQLFTHWGARGIRKLHTEVLKHGKRYAMLTINRSTNSAVLPADYDGFLFVGWINEENKKVPLKPRNDLVYEGVVECSEPETCGSCGQDRSICDNLFVYDEVNLINIEGTVYEEFATKKLYPNGDYYIERSTPMKDLDSGIVSYHQFKEYITHFDLKKCGCMDDCEENKNKLRKYCPDVYGNFFTGDCDSDCCETQGYGGFFILEEQGILMVEPSYPFEEVYIEYVGFIPKINGQYVFPQVAFETLVEWIKFKSVENKPNVPLSERNWVLENYKRERRNMEKVMGAVSLTSIYASVGLLPKFDITTERFCDYYNYNQRFRA